MPNKQKVLIWTGNETVDNADFRAAFKKVIEAVTKKEEKLENAIKEMRSTLVALREKISQESSASRSETKRIVTAELESLLRRFSSESKKIDKRLSLIVDGQDADEEKITEEVMSKVPLFEDLVKEVLSKLSEQEKDIFEINDIKGLEEELEKLRARKVGGGGGVIINSPRIESLTGTLNGTNKVFTVGHKPSFVTMDGQMLYVDNGYALSYVSGVATLTFDNAPQSDSILKSHF